MKEENKENKEKMVPQYTKWISPLISYCKKFEQILALTSDIGKLGNKISLSIFFLN